MSVQQKLIECEKSLVHSPVEKIEDALSLLIKNMLDSIINNEIISKKELLSPNDSTHKIINISESMDYKDNNNNNNDNFNSINSTVNRDKIESLVNRYFLI